jgi:hypothetical protein
MRRNIIVTVAVLLAGLSHTAASQTCLGGLSFRNNPTQLDAGVSLGNDAIAFSAGATFGSANGPFASLGAGYTIIDSEDLFDDDPTGFSLSGTAGFAASGGENKWEFCPLAGFAWTSLSADALGENVTVKLTSFQFGASLGFPLPSSGTTTVIPFAGLSYARIDGTIEGGGESFDLDAETYTPGTFGVGISFNRNVSIRGAVEVPFGLEEADPTFHFGISFGLGGRS